MKKLIYILLVLVTTPFLFACDEDSDETEDEVQRTSHTVTLYNSLGDTGCYPVGGISEFEVVFIVSYRDIQVDATINPGAYGFINVLVEDTESINVIVQDLSGTILANANVNVRTTSRPEFLEDSPRRIRYCEAFQLNFENF